MCTGNALKVMLWHDSDVWSQQCGTLGHFGCTAAEFAYEQRHDVTKPPGYRFTHEYHHLVQKQNSKYPPVFMVDNGLDESFDSSLRTVCKKIGVDVLDKLKYPLMSTNVIFSTGESPRHFDEVSTRFR